MSIDGPVVADAKFIKEQAAIGRELALGQKHAFGVIFSLLGHAAYILAEHKLKELGSFLMKIGIRGVRSDGVEVFRDGTDIAVDRPLVVVENDDEFFSVRRDVVHRLINRATSEGSITRDADDVLVSAIQVTRSGHAERCTECSACVASPVAIMLAFAAQAEAVEAFILADGVNAVPAPSEHLMHVGLMGDVKNKAVFGCVKHTMHGQGQLDHSEIRPEVAACLTEGFDEGGADFFRECGQLLG